MAVDITNFYGYKNQFTFYLENNGVNPINVQSIELLEQNTLELNNIFAEIENTIPMVVAGNSTLDILTDWYSLNTTDYTSDVTFTVEYDIIDMTDLTTIIDTSFTDISFSFVNYNATDQTFYSLLEAINKHFKVGPNGTDTTIRSSSFSNTGYPVIEFIDKLKFQLFIMKYSPQFVLFNNVGNYTNVLCGSFYYNTDSNAIECYFTDEEKNALMGLTFDNVVMFYADVWDLTKY